MTRIQWKSKTATLVFIAVVATSVAPALADEIRPAADAATGSIAADAPTGWQDHGLAYPACPAPAEAAHGTYRDLLDLLDLLAK